MERGGWRWRGADGWMPMLFRGRRMPDIKVLGLGFWGLGTALMLLNSGYLGYNRG